MCSIFSLLVVALTRCPFGLIGVEAGCRWVKLNCCSCTLIYWLWVRVTKPGSWMMFMPRSRFDSPNSLMLNQLRNSCLKASRFLLKIERLSMWGYQYVPFLQKTQGSDSQRWNPVWNNHSESVQCQVLGACFSKYIAFLSLGTWFAGTATPCSGFRKIYSCSGAWRKELFMLIWWKEKPFVRAKRMRMQSNTSLPIGV